MSWIEIARIEDIPLRGARVVRTRAGCIGLFRTGAAEVYALADRCPHRGGPLSEGIVHGRSVTCPLHNWVFDLATGQAQGAEAGQVAAYPLRLERGRILIEAAVLDRRGAA